MPGVYPVGAQAAHTGIVSMTSKKWVGRVMTVREPEVNVSVLVGNGLSIAFNPELTLAAITREMIIRMQASSDDGDKVIHAMNEIARRSAPLDEVTDEDFEKLVGAFDSQALTLEELGRLAELVATEDSALRFAIRDVSKFSERVRDMGISYVLEVITERSRADHARDSKLHATLGEIMDTFQGRVTFANLNYDTLLLSALGALDAPFADMGFGPSPVSLVVERPTNTSDREDPTRYTGYQLRKSLNFPVTPKHRVRLLQLHGDRKSTRLNSSHWE